MVIYHHSKVLKYVLCYLKVPLVLWGLFSSMASCMKTFPASLFCPFCVCSATVALSAHADCSLSVPNNFLLLQPGTNKQANNNKMLFFLGKTYLKEQA